MKGHLQIYHAFIRDPNAPDDEDDDEEETNNDSNANSSIEANGKQTAKLLCLKIYFSAHRQLSYYL